MHLLNQSLFLLLLNFNILTGFTMGNRIFNYVVDILYVIVKKLMQLFSKRYAINAIAN